jgi:hypothetical protein
MNEREAKLTVVLGATGTGKTTVLQEIIKAVPTKTLVCTPSDAEWTQYPDAELSKPADFDFSGVRRFIFPPLLSTKEFTEVIKRLNCFTNGVLIFDDCRMYFQANEVTNSNLRLFLGRKRQKMTDIFAVGHGFTEVPPMFFTFATDMILFRTTDDISRRKNCLKDYEKMCELQREVNNKATKNQHFYKIFKFA